MSESWLRKTTKNPEISIANYNISRQDRTAKGGGIAIYCKDSPQSSVLQYRSVPKQFELLLLKIHHSLSGPLQISQARPYLSKIICRNCCNPSFLSSEIPNDWKAAAVIPLFKGSDTLDPNCYRPIISILPCVSKVFKSPVNKQITDHFESHLTFSAMKSGFRAGHGCTSATLKVLNNIITAIDKRHYCAAVFIDLAKAFDSVNHNILIGRLDSLGFSNDASPG